MDGKRRSRSGGVMKSKLKRTADTNQRRRWLEAKRSGEPCGACSVTGDVRSVAPGPGPVQRQVRPCRHPFRYVSGSFYFYRMALRAHLDQAREVLCVKDQRVVLYTLWIKPSSAYSQSSRVHARANLRRFFFVSTNATTCIFAHELETLMKHIRSTPINLRT
jgi:hypothetical protein